MQPHAPVMEALCMPGRFDLLEVADSAPNQWSTTRIFPTSSLRIVSLCSWRILELENMEARENRAHPQTRMQTS